MIRPLRSLTLSCTGLALLLTCVLAPIASAQWRPTGVPVCSALAEQSAAATASDGAGGMYVVWQDFRNGAVSNGLFDIYAQHVLASGAVDPAWNAAGIPVCTLAEAQTKPSILADGSGGAFVAWLDRRNGTNSAAFMTHLVPSGVDGAWPANGTPLTNPAAVMEWEVQMVRDGSTGVFALCPIYLTYLDLRVQHVFITGALDPNFTAAGTRAGIKDSWGNRNESITTDGAGGAIVAWITGGSRAYANRVLASGAVDPAWPLGGLIVQTSGSSGSYPTAIADGAGGAVVVWSQYNDVDLDIYAQHVLSNGTLDSAWPVAGLAVCTATGNQQVAHVTSDGAGGVIAAWTDFRNLSLGSLDVYAQHVRASGDVDPAWPVNGRAPSTQSVAAFARSLVTDGLGGAIVVWEDRSASRPGLYAQHLASNGAVDPAWPAAGAQVSGMWRGLVSIGFSPDGAGGMLAAWHEFRMGDPSPRGADIYARKIPRTGTHRITTTNPSGAIYLLAPDSLNFQDGRYYASLPALDVTPADEVEFRFRSSEYNVLTSLTANAVSLGVVPNYTFRNVTQDVTLTASFANTPWTVETPTPAETYVPLGVPMTFADSSVSALLPDLGAPNDFVWRLAHWNPVTAAYDYANGPLTKLRAGDGYWLATKAARVVSVQGKPVVTPFTSINLLGDAASGWNQIANPYRFPIADTALTIVAGGPAIRFMSGANSYTDTTLWDWAGGSSYVAVHTLQPNRSYWVRKRVAGAVALRFPSYSSVGAAPTAPSRPAEAQWALALTARQGESATSQVLLGAWRGAAMSAPLRAEAPPRSPQGGLSLHAGEMGEAHARQIADFVSANATGTWLLELSGAEAPGEVQLEVAGFDLPAGLVLTLSDAEQGWRRELHAGEAVMLAAASGTRRLTLEVGDGAAHAPDVAGARLLSAWPNPFRRQMGFTAQLVAGGDVRVEILDVQGRLVRVLDRRGAPAGESVIVWDGRGASGAEVRPGVYLARYVSGGRQGTVRLVKLD